MPRRIGKPIAAPLPDRCLPCLPVQSPHCHAGRGNGPAGSLHRRRPAFRNHSPEPVPRSHRRLSRLTPHPEPSHGCPKHPMGHEQTPVHRPRRPDHSTGGQWKTPLSFPDGAPEPANRKTRPDNGNRCTRPGLPLLPVRPEGTISRLAGHRPALSLQPARTWDTGKTGASPVECRNENPLLPGPAAGLFFSASLTEQGKSQTAALLSTPRMKKPPLPGFREAATPMRPAFRIRQGFSGTGRPVFFPLEEKDATGFSRFHRQKAGLPARRSSRCGKPEWRPETGHSGICFSGKSAFGAVPFLFLFRKVCLWKTAPCSDRYRFSAQTGRFTSVPARGKTGPAAG